MKFLITCLTAVFVSCPQTPEVEVSPAQEYKITYTVSGTGKDAVTVNGPATAKSGDTVTFTIDGIEFDIRLRLQRSNRRIQFHHAGTGYPRHDCR